MVDIPTERTAANSENHTTRRLKRDIMVTDEELNILRGAPSFRLALVQWASLQSNAVGFNEWQQAVSRIRPWFPDDEEAPPKGDRDYNQRIASLWNEKTA